MLGLMSRADTRAHVLGAEHSAPAGTSVSGPARATRAGSGHAAAHLRCFVHVSYPKNAVFGGIFTHKLAASRIAVGYSRHYSRLLKAKMLFSAGCFRQ